MKQLQLTTLVNVYENPEELPPCDAELLSEARSALGSSYAPYSQFKVAAAARLKDGTIVRGANQENAAYPMCLCAERVALGNAQMQAAGQAILSMAITVFNPNKTITEPAAPCGACRQALAEQEERQGSPIRLLLQGAVGKVYELESGSSLLPMNFNGSFF